MSEQDNEHQAFLAEVTAGLSGRPKTLPCKYLYDARGSALFEAICETEDYYLTRADLALHNRHVEEIAQLIGPEAHIIEFGSGAGVKTAILLAALRDCRAYTPIEISATALQQSAQALAGRFPGLEIRPLQADYTRLIPSADLNLDPPPRRRVIYFPGSTISNFTHEEALEFLRRMRRIVHPDGAVLIGVDLVKDGAFLEQAYNDRQGLTAEFNLNLLTRINRELGGDFRLDDFRHESRFNPTFERIEMHLTAVRPTTAHVNGRRFEFAQGESIHTENSHKYSIDGFSRMAEQAGLRPVKAWTDPDGLFSTHYLEPADLESETAMSGRRRHRQR